MATDFGMGQLADDIRKAKHAGIVKRLSKNIAGDDERWKWEEENKDVMVHLLNAKLEQCPEFRQCLIDSAGLVIAEATPSRIWGTGLSPYVTKHTSAEYWLGSNLLGAILTEMSQQLVGGGGLSSSYVESDANELSVQDTSLENQEHLLHSDQQLISESNQPGVMSVELSDSASQPDSQVPHQGDSSSVNPTACPPTSQPVELSTNQTTKSINQPKCQNNSLNSTHKGNQQQLQSQLANKPNVLAGDGSRISRPKQKNPASLRASRSYSTPNRRGESPWRTDSSGTPDIRDALKWKEPSSSPDNTVYNNALIEHITQITTLHTDHTAVLVTLSVNIY